MPNSVITSPTPGLGGVYTPSDHFFTIEDVMVLPRNLPSGQVDYELQDGRLIVVSLPGDPHAATSSNIVTELKIQGERKGHGRACDAVGVVFPSVRETLRGPDAVFITNARLPIRKHKTGNYWESIPELFVEVLSPSNAKWEIEEKIEIYLEHGGVAVWVLDPGTQTLKEYRASSAVRVYTALDTLAIPDIIPGFSVCVGDLFKE